jgi:hypothetical protein
MNIISFTLFLLITKYVYEFPEIPYKQNSITHKLAGDQLHYSIHRLFFPSPSEYLFGQSPFEISYSDRPKGIPLPSLLSSFPFETISKHNDAPHSKLQLKSSRPIYVMKTIPNKEIQLFFSLPPPTSLPFLAISSLPHPTGRRKTRTKGILTTLLPHSS